VHLACAVRPKLAFAIPFWRHRGRTPSLLAQDGLSSSGRDETPNAVAVGGLT